MTNTDFSPDGRWLATGSWDNLVNLFDLQKGNPFAEPAKTLKSPNSVNTLSFSDNSQRLIVGSAFKPTVVDLATNPSAIQEFQLPLQDVRATAISPDGKRAITGTLHEVRIWDLDIDTALKHARSRIAVQ